MFSWRLLIAVKKIVWKENSICECFLPFRGDVHDETRGKKRAFLQKNNGFSPLSRGSCAPHVRRVPLSFLLFSLRLSVRISPFLAGFSSPPPSCSSPPPPPPSLFSLSLSLSMRGISSSSSTRLLGRDGAARGADAASPRDSSWCGNSAGRVRVSVSALKLQVILQMCFSPELSDAPCAASINASSLSVSQPSQWNLLDWLLYVTVNLHIIPQTTPFSQIPKIQFWGQGRSSSDPHAPSLQPSPNLGPQPR